MFEGLTGLLILRLDCQKNSLQLKEGAFDYLIAIENIYLSYSGITDLPIGIFNQNEKLKELDLSGNKLTMYASYYFTSSHIHIHKMLLYAMKIFDSIFQLQEKLLRFAHELDPSSIGQSKLALPWYTCF